jgi:cytochrome P450
MDKMNSNNFMFGYGARICPGLHLAQHEGELALAYLVKYFDFELACRPEEVIRIQAFTARPKYLPMKFILRNGVKL